MNGDDAYLIRIPKSPEERQMLGRVYEALARVLLKDASTQPRDAHVDEDDDLLDVVSTPSIAYGSEDKRADLEWFLREITTNARLLVRAIADETLRNGIVWSSALRKRLNAKNDGTLGGWAASIGFATKRTRLPKPYERDWEYGRNGWEGVYRMDRSVAEAVLELVEENGRVREKS